MKTNRGNPDDIGVRRDVADYFDVVFPAGVAKAGGVAQPASPANENDGVVVLEKWGTKVIVPEGLFLQALAEAQLSPHERYYSTQVVYSIKIAAERRGLASLATELDVLHKNPAPGPILVRSPNGEPYEPRVVSHQNAEKPGEFERMKAEVMAYFV